MTSSVWIGIVVFVVMAGALTFGSRDDDDEEVKNRMSLFSNMGEEESAAADDKPKAGPAGPKKANPIFQKLGQLITPRGIAMWLEVQLEKADIPLRPNEYAGMIFLAGTVPGGLVFLATGNFMLTAMIGGSGFSVPFMWLFLAYRRRLRQFNDQMLDTLTLLANAVKAGYSMVQAMEMVAKESPPPMGTEFTRVIREVSLGVTIEEALVNMKNRVPSSELDLMVTVIMIQRQIGGNLSEILESIAHTIRERNKLQGMISALTAQGRMSGMVIGGLPFALAGILYVINPKYMSLLWTYSSGAFHSYYLIIGCIMMEIVGFIIIGKITNVEV